MALNQVVYKNNYFKVFNLLPNQSGTFCNTALLKVDNVADDFMEWTNQLKETASDQKQNKQLKQYCKSCSERLKDIYNKLDYINSENKQDNSY